MIIVPLLLQHWPEVERIYLEGLATKQASFETESPGWEAWDRSHRPNNRFVIKIQGKVVGWAALSYVSPRKVYEGVAEVSIYIDSAHSRKGLGKLLIKHLIQNSEQSGIWTLQATMFPENIASLKLHQQHGFRILGRREKVALHYGVWRDTIILERRSKSVHFR